AARRGGGRGGRRRDGGVRRALPAERRRAADARREDRAAARGARRRRPRARGRSPRRRPRPPLPAARLRAGPRAERGRRSGALRGLDDAGDRVAGLATIAARQAKEGDAAAARATLAKADADVKAANPARRDELAVRVIRAEVSIGDGDAALEKARSFPDPDD